MHNFHKKALPLVCLALSMPTYSKDQTTAWHAVTWENDFIADDDSGYTNGIGYTWGYHSFGTMDQSPLPGFLKKMASPLPGYGINNKRHAISYRVAQAMFTPADIKTEELQPDDRPYAGLLLWQGTTHHLDEHVSQRYGLTLGVVGPASGAEYVQNAIHTLIGVNQAEGWDNQLANEPVFAIATEQLQRLHLGRLSKTIDYDWYLAGRGSLGTLKSELGAGLGFRFGHNLQSSFAGASIMPTRNPMTWHAQGEWHGFINLYGRYVFNDITIDGNTFKDSHSVTLKHEQIFIVLGFSYNEEDWGLAFSLQDGSAQFTEKKENDLFGQLYFQLARTALISLFTIGKAINNRRHQCLISVSVTKALKITIIHLQSPLGMQYPVQTHTGMHDGIRIKLAFCLQHFPQTKHQIRA